MSARKRLIAAIVFADFAALNAYALYAEGLGGFVTFVSELGPWGWVIAADLLIALGMVLVWMWRDARERERTPLPYTLLTFATGSLGPLLYVALDGESRSSQESMTSTERKRRGAAA